MDSPGRLAHRQIGGEGDHAVCQPKAVLRYPPARSRCCRSFLIELIKVVKIAAIEDGLKLSVAVEEALRD